MVVQRTSLKGAKVKVIDEFTIDEDDILKVGLEGTIVVMLQISATLRRLMKWKKTLGGCSSTVSGNTTSAHVIPLSIKNFYSRRNKAI